MSFTWSLAYFTVTSISLHLQRAHTDAFTLYFLFSPPPHHTKWTRGSAVNYVTAPRNTLINFSLYFVLLSFQKVKASFNQVGSEPSMPCIRTLLFCNVIWISIVMKSLNCDASYSTPLDWIACHCLQSVSQKSLTSKFCISSFILSYLI